MKSSFALCLLLCLMLASLRGNDAIRKEASTATAEEYWKKVMKDEPLPQPIKELLISQAAAGDDHAGVDGEKKELKEKVKINRFMKNFDTQTNAIIYHTTQSHGG